MLLQFLLLIPALSNDVLLPEGPAARAWASVDPAAPLSDEWIKGLGDDAAEVLGTPKPWETPAAWEAWSRWIMADELGPKERAGLALLAARGARSEDAWDHFATLVAEPAIAAALMPRLLPGIPAGLMSDAPLPDNCLLHPTPPPGALAAARGRSRPVTASTEFDVGDAKLRLIISVEPSGVEVTLHHLSGGPATVRIQLPELLEREVRVSYIDWMRQDERNAPLEAVLKPEMEGPVQLFGRFLARREQLPSTPSGSLPTQLLTAGLWIEPEDEEHISDLHSAAATALSKALRVPGGARTGTKLPRELPSAGLVIRLSGGPAGARTLSRIVSATEAWLKAQE